MDTSKLTIHEKINFRANIVNYGKAYGFRNHDGKMFEPDQLTRLMEFPYEKWYGNKGSVLRPYCFGDLRKYPIYYN